MNMLLVMIGLWFGVFMLVQLLSPKPSQKKSEQIISETQKDVLDILRVWNKK